MAQHGPPWPTGPLGGFLGCNPSRSDNPAATMKRNDDLTDLTSMPNKIYVYIYLFIYIYIYMYVCIYSSYHAALHVSLSPTAWRAAMDSSWWHAVSQKKFSHCDLKMTSYWPSQEVSRIYPCFFMYDYRISKITCKGPLPKSYGQFERPSGCNPAFQAAKRQLQHLRSRQHQMRGETQRLSQVPKQFAVQPDPRCVFLASGS